MATTLKPDMEARIAGLAKRLGFAGPDSAERVLEVALDGLDAVAPRPRLKLTAAEIAEEYRTISAAGRRWRQEHPEECDENNPPSKAWQDELYDERGLPK